jgi:hypothetical protein
MNRKRTVTVKFAKGITMSKNYQSVRYDIGAEATYDGELSPSEYRTAVAELEDVVNAELRRRKDQTTDAFALGSGGY